MLHLNPIPHDTPSLRAALVTAVEPLELGADAVRVDGEFPSLGAIRLNLTGAHFHRGLPFAKAAANAHEAFFAREVEVTASPARVETLPFTLALRGSDAVFALSGSALTLARCGSGTLELFINHADLEKAVTDLVRTAAEKKGAELRSVHIELHADGPRSLQLRAVAEAKAMFVTAKLTLTGRVEVGEDLEVRLSGLGCGGDGMIANIAAGALRSKITGFEGRAWSLKSLVPNLRSVALDSADGLRIRAEFGQ